MKVLVTGGAGYIGSHTCVELLDAGYEIVVASAIEKNYCLLVCGDPTTGFLNQLPAERRYVRSLELLSHIAHSDLGKPCVSVPCSQTDESIRARPCLVKRFDRRSSRAQKHKRARVRTPESGYISCVIFWIGIGFVGVLLLFVDDDHPQI